MYCKHCGAEIPDNSQKCPNCGKPLGNPELTLPVSKEVGDLIIRIAAGVLGTWLVLMIYRNVFYSISAIFNWIGYIRYDIRNLLEALYSLITLIPNLAYLGLGAYYIYTAVVWDRNKMDSNFSMNAIFVVLIIAMNLINYLFGLLHYGLYYASSFKWMFKMCLPSLIAFIAFYLIVSLICPTIPLAKIKDAKSVTDSLGSIKDILPESKPAPVQPVEEPKPNKPAADKAAQNVQKPAPAMNTAAGPVLLQTNRGVVKWFLLSLITCDIYALYQIHKMAKEMNICCEGDGRSTPGLIKLCLFTILTCGFYGIYYLYSLEDRIKANAPRYGQNIPEGGGTILLWIFLGWWACLFGIFFAYHILFRNMNILFTAYNNEQMAAMNQSDIQGGY